MSAEPLYHPPPLADRLKPGPFGDYVLSVGRLETVKRVDLIVRALALVDGVRLVVVGEGPLRGSLEATAIDAGVADRVVWAGGIDDRQLVDLYAGALAVVFPPYDEDYGYVTLEAFLAGKPVVTTTDAGGPLEFVEDGVTGFVVAPEPRAIADAIARLVGGSPRGGRPRRGRIRESARHHVDRRRGTPDGIARRAMTTSTSVVIPAYNEAAAIGPLVAGLRGAATWHEILVIDDGSDDGTADRASAAGAHVIRHPYNKGNGAAVKTGIRQATGRYVLIMDADGQHQAADAPRLVAHLDEYDLVIGARSGRSHANLVRRVGNQALNVVAGYLAETTHRRPDLRVSSGRS